MKTVQVALVTAKLCGMGPPSSTITDSVKNVSCPICGSQPTEWCEGRPTMVEWIHTARIGEYWDSAHYKAMRYAGLESD